MKWRQQKNTQQARTAAVACLVSVSARPVRHSPSYSHTRAARSELGAKLIQFTFHFKFINHVHTEFSRPGCRWKDGWASGFRFYFLREKRVVFLCKTLGSTWCTHNAMMRRICRHSRAIWIGLFNWILLLWVLWMPKMVNKHFELVRWEFSTFFFIHSLLSTSSTADAELMLISPSRAREPCFDTSKSLSWFMNFSCKFKDTFFGTLSPKLLRYQPRSSS